MDVLLAILPYLLPPIFGAAIGYATNRVAIQMLFRPRTAKRFLGVRVPMTPGIVPKSREELAQSIGSMVAHELLAPDSIRAQLASPELQTGLRLWIRGQRRSLMQRPIVGQDGPHQALLSDLVDEVLPQLLSSPQLASVVTDLCQRMIEEFGRRQLRDFFTERNVADLAYDRLLPFLTSSEVRGFVSDHCVAWLEEQFEMNRPLGDYMPDGARETLYGFLQENMPVISAAVVHMLRSPTTRDRLVEIGQAVVQDEVSRQGFLSRAFMRLSGKERDIIDKMPQTVDRMLDQVETAINGRSVQTQLVAAGRGVIEDIMERRVNDVFGGRRNMLYSSVHIAVDRAFDVMASTSRASVGRLVGDFYPQYSDTTLAELLESSLGLRNEQLAFFASDEIVRYLRSDSAATQAADLLTSSLVPDQRLTLDDLISLSPELEERLDDYLTARLVGFLSDQVTVLSDILDVERLVMERVNSFDVAQVERLVLGVTGRHLRWINYFGAVLGFLIGIAQVVLQLLV